MRPESAKVTPKVHDEALEKMEKQLNLWIRDMTVNRKKHSDSIVVRPKAREIWPRIHGQETLKPSQMFCFKEVLHLVL